MEKVRLGDVATYINGYAFKPADWSDTGVPIIRIQDLTGNSYQLNRYNGTFDSKYEVLCGDILISWSASLGIYVWNGEKAVLNQHIFKVVFDKGEINKSFFVYQVKNILEKAMSEAHGATMKHLTKPVFDALPFYMPKMEVQNEIANTLDKLTNLIDKRKKQLEKLDELIKSRFVEMFGGKEYPVVTLSELVTGKVPSAKKDFSPDDYIKYIDISSIDNKRNIMTGYTEYKMSDAPSRAQQHIIYDDIVVSTVRPNLKNVAITTFNDSNLVASSGFCILRAKKCLPSYLMAVVCSNAFTNEMSKLVTGANYPAIKDSDVMNYTVPFPPLELQKEFESFTKEVNKSKFVVQQALEKAQLLFDSLMQKYFG